MRKILRFITAGLVATGFATPGTAQGYNSFVIEIPYEFSVPASLTHASVYCRANGSNPSDRFTFERGIPLDNGQARGALKLGYANFGSTDDLVQLREDQTETLKRIVRQPGFALTLQCNVRDFHEEGVGQMFVSGEADRPSIFSRSASGGFSSSPASQYYLDPTATLTSFEATFRAQDNGISAPPARQTATTAAPTVSPGLQSLQSILQGE